MILLLKIAVCNFNFEIATITHVRHLGPVPAVIYYCHSLYNANRKS